MRKCVGLCLILFSLMAFAKEDQERIEMTLYSPYVPAGYYGAGPADAGGNAYLIKESREPGPVEYCFKYLCNILSKQGLEQVLQEHEQILANAIDQYAKSLDQSLSEADQAFADIIKGKAPSYGEAGKKYQEKSQALRATESKTKMVNQEIAQINADFRQSLDAMAIDLGATAFSDLEIQQLYEQHQQTQDDFAQVAHSLYSPASSHLTDEDVATVSEAEVPYDFRTDATSNFGQDMYRLKKFNHMLRQRLEHNSSANRTKLNALQFSDDNLTYADYFNAIEFDPETAEAFRVFALEATDVALGFVPFIGQGYGVVSDAYSMIEGKNILSGATLTTSDRVIAGASILTLGLASRGAKILTKLPKLLDARLIKKGAGELAKIVDFVLHSSAVRRITQSRMNGFDVLPEGGYKHFDKVAKINNPLPSDGVFVHVTKRKYAEGIMRGEARLARDKVTEAFISSAEALPDRFTKRQVAEKLSLYSDEAGTTLRELDDYVKIEFKFKGPNPPPIDEPTLFGLDGKPRLYGFIPGGKTKGGAPEWLVNADAPLNGIIDISTMKIKEILD